MEQLREQGIESLSEVKLSNLEPDGQLSVVKVKPDGEGGGKKASERRPRA